MSKSTARATKPRVAAKPAARGRKKAGEEGVDRAVRERRFREQIIRAAAEAYQQHGYEATGMSDIASRVGLTAAALYWYFGSKEEILFAFLERTIQHLYRFASDSVRSENPVERLRELMHAYVLWQIQHRDMSSAYERIFAIGQLRNSLPPPKRDKIKAMERQFYEMFRDVVVAAAGAQKVSKGRAKAIAFALIGMVEHLNAWFQSDGELSVAQIAIIYSDLAVRMASEPFDVGVRRDSDMSMPRTETAVGALPG